jgi:hypothetical protein
MSVCVVCSSGGHLSEALAAVSFVRDPAILSHTTNPTYDPVWLLRKRITL